MLQDSSISKSSKIQGSIWTYGNVCRKVETGYDILLKETPCNADPMVCGECDQGAKGKVQWVGD